MASHVSCISRVAATFLAALFVICALSTVSFAQNPPPQSARPAVKDLLLEPVFPIQGERFIGQVEQQEDGKFVLVAGSVLYYLDKQLEAAHYDRARVKIVGKLAPEENTIYVETIERV